MAGLKKPAQCPITYCKEDGGGQCQSTTFTHMFHPERWVCGNGHITVERAQRNPTGICRECGAKKSEVPFSNHGNICKKCKSEYHASYRETHAVEIREQHRESYQRDKTKRQAAVRIAVQRSPEAFIRYLLHHVNKGSTLYRKGRDPHRWINKDLEYQFLLDLYKKQDGKCALSGLQMEHKFDSLRTISIDRIDSGRGYQQDNIQLVCKAFNLMKHNRSDAEARQLLTDYLEQQTRSANL